jgi:transposase
MATGNVICRRHKVQKSGTVQSSPAQPTQAGFRQATVINALIKQQLEKRLSQFENDITKIDALMWCLAHQEQSMSKRLDILFSIPGIGGLAPMSQSSGKWQVKALIQGGRQNLRHAVFMPALVAIRHNANLKANTINWSLLLLSC